MKKFTLILVVVLCIFSCKKNSNSRISNLENNYAFTYGKWYAIGYVNNYIFGTIPKSDTIYFDSNEIESDEYLEFTKTKMNAIDREKNVPTYYNSIEEINKSIIIRVYLDGVNPNTYNYAYRFSLTSDTMYMIYGLKPLTILKKM